MQVTAVISSELSNLRRLVCGQKSSKKKKSKTKPSYYSASKSRGYYNPPRSSNNLGRFGNHNYNSQTNQQRSHQSFSSSTYIGQNAMKNSSTKKRFYDKFSTNEYSSSQYVIESLEK